MATRLNYHPVAYLRKTAYVVVWAGLALQLCLPPCALSEPQTIRYSDAYRFNQTAPGISDDGTIPIAAGQLVPPRKPAEQPEPVLRPPIFKDTGMGTGGITLPTQPTLLTAPTNAGSSGPGGSLSGSASVTTAPPSSVQSTAEPEPNFSADEGTPALHIIPALNEALLKSPQAAAFRAQLPIAVAGYAAATMMPNPVLFRDEGAIAEQVLRLGVQKTWDPPWKLALRLLAAKEQVRETKLEILNNLWQFRAAVRQAYTELVIAQETYETLVDLADLSKKLMQVSDKRFHAGDVPELDVLKARLAFSQAEIDRRQGGGRIRKAKQQLNVTLGRPLPGAIRVPRLPTFKLSTEKNELMPDFSKPVPELQDLIAQAMENRLELRTISQQLKVARAQLRNAYGSIIPDPIVASGSSKNGNAPSGPKVSAFFVTLNIEMPGFTYSQGDIARLKATIKQLHAQDQSQRNQILADVSSAYNDLIIAREKIRVYHEHVLSDSQEVARLARRSYEVGQSDITSTLQAQQANVQIRSQYLDAVNSYQQAFTNLERAVGEPLE